MTTKNFQVLFVQAKNRTNKSNQSPIYCRLTFKGERKQFAAGISIESKHWNARLQSIDKKHPQNIQYNYILEEIKSKVLTSILLCSSRDADCTAADVYNQFIGNDKLKKSTSLLLYYRQYLTRIQKLIGKEIKENTFKKFEYVANHLEAFLKWKFN